MCMDDYVVFRPVVVYVNTQAIISVAVQSVHGGAC